MQNPIPLPLLQQQQHQLTSTLFNSVWGCGTVGRAGHFLSLSSNDPGTCLELQALHGIEKSCALRVRVASFDCCGISLFALCPGSGLVGSCLLILPTNWSQWEPYLQFLGRISTDSISSLLFGLSRWVELTWECALARLCSFWHVSVYKSSDLYMHLSWDVC